MFRFLSKCLGIAAGLATPKTAARSKPQGRPQLESLEDRQLLTAGVNPFTGALVIQGTSAGDTAIVSHQVVNNVGYYKVTENGVNQWFADSKVWGNRVFFFGYDGNDVFVNLTNLNAYAYGGRGNDVLANGFLGFSSAGHATFYGGDDDDFLYGGLNNDHLYGGSGKDTLYGDAGSDYLSGGTGSDHLYGGAGDDTLDGGVGDTRDFLNGGAGRDRFRLDWTRNLDGALVNMDAPSDFSALGGDSYYTS